jgi:DNA-binding beta-propeller fold protein YncE
MRLHLIVTLIAVGVLAAGCGNGGSGTGGGRFAGSIGSTAKSYLLHTDSNLNTLSVASIDPTGTLRPGGASTQTGLQPVAMATTPDGKFAYVLNANSGTVSQFVVASDGSLTQPAPAIGTGLQPTAMAIDPQERFVVVANTNSGAGGTLSVFNINTTTGVLTAASTTAILLNIADPKTVTISGNNIYVADANLVDVVVFTALPTSFTLQPGSPFPAGSAGTNITALYSPPQASTVLYAADTNTNSVLSFSITGGALTPTGSALTGRLPVAMIADKQNRFLFVANETDSSISVFTVNPTTGALATASTTMLVSGTAPNMFAYDPINNFLLVSESGIKQVVSFSVNTSSGALSTLVGPLTVTNAPSAMAVATP